MIYLRSILFSIGIIIKIFFYYNRYSIDATEFLSQMDFALIFGVGWTIHLIPSIQFIDERFMSELGMAISPKPLVIQTDWCGF